jgi:hypothetical protein
MEEMQSEKNKAGKINIIVSTYFKEVLSDRIKIFRITLDQAQLYEIEIKEMKDEECQYTGTGPDHELRKE